MLPAQELADLLELHHVDPCRLTDKVDGKCAVYIQFKNCTGCAWRRRQTCSTTWCRSIGCGYGTSDVDDAVPAPVKNNGK